MEFYSRTKLQIILKSNFYDKKLNNFDQLDSFTEEDFGKSLQLGHIHIFQLSAFNSTTLSLRSSHAMSGLPETFRPLASPDALDGYSPLSKMEDWEVVFTTTSTRPSFEDPEDPDMDPTDYTPCYGKYPRGLQGSRGHTYAIFTNSTTQEVMKKLVVDASPMESNAVIHTEVTDPEEIPFDPDNIYHNSSCPFNCSCDFACAVKLSEDDFISPFLEVIPARADPAVYARAIAVANAAVMAVNAAVASPEKERDAAHKLLDEAEHLFNLWATAAWGERYKSYVNLMMGFVPYRLALAASA